jgi:hypothetical protein
MTLRTVSAGLLFKYKASGSPRLDDIPKAAAGNAAAAFVMVFEDGRDAVNKQPSRFSRTDRLEMWPAVFKPVPCGLRTMA